MASAAFKSDAGFVQALDKACTTFINKNAVTKKANVSFVTCCYNCFSFI